MTNNSSNEEARSASPRPATCQAFVDEFKTALEQEIAAAKANRAASAVSLSDGRLIAPVGGTFHYRFNTATRLRVPPDTDGELVLPNRPDDPIRVTVLEISDLNVIVAVPTHIGPLIPAARLQIDLTMLLRQLIDRIDEKGSTNHPAADRMLGLQLPSGVAVCFDPKDRCLNPEQKQAVASTLSQDTTFIWGPPGTGKTYSIGEIGVQLFVKGKTLLIASHTNTAVDGAVLKITAALDGQFQEGDVLRVGEPVKPELVKRQNNVEIVMRRIAEKRSAALKTRQQERQRERQLKLAEAEEIQQLVEVAEWLSEVPADLEKLNAENNDLLALEAKRKSITDRLSALLPDEPRMQRLQHETEVILARQGDRERIHHELGIAMNAMERYYREHKELEIKLQEEKNLLRKSHDIEPLRQRSRQLPSYAEAQQRVETAERRYQEASNRASVANHALFTKNELLNRIRNTGTIRRLWLKLPKEQEQAAQVEVLRLEANQAEGEARVAENDRESARSTLEEVRKIANKLSQHGSVPDLTTQEQVVASQKARVEETKTAYLDAIQQVKEKELAAAAMEAALDDYIRTYELTPDEGAQHAKEYLEELDRFRKMDSDVTAKRHKLADSLGKKLRELLEVLAHWGLADRGRGNITAMLADLKTAQQRGLAKTGHRDLAQIRLDLNRLAADIQSIEDELRLIDQQLASVDEDLIKNARILATTLTRSYLRNSIQSRTFDTVLVDEASMAPIPALWAVATLTQRAMVVIGDFLQLPPIVQSTEALAKKWLGRDVFEVSGISGAWHRREPLPDHFVALKEQHRMHPAISKIVNELVYKGELRDGATVSGPTVETDLYRWLASDTHWDAPVILIDTSRYGGWNIAKDKSRCNPLSAFLVTNTVGRMLSDTRPSITAGHPRILVISPYRPHAKLLQVLLRESSVGKDEEVVANTVHSFQGSEADAVVLDLVVDNPHWRTSITTPQANAEIRRLLNVALTRTKRRLVVIGNFEWLQAKGARSFVGRDLLPWLKKRHPVLPAEEFMAADRSLSITDGLAPQECVPPSSIHHLLVSDINQAQQRVIVFSPQLSPVVIEHFTETLREAGRQNIAVFVVTCPIVEYPRTKRNEGVRAETLLRESGVRLVHKKKMLENIAILDDEIIWCASGGLLDDAATDQGVPTFRRVSNRLVTEFKDIYHFDELLEPYQTEPYLCPICNSEILVTDAYWCCAQKGCYTRSIGDPPLQDGKISLPCGNDFRLGEWGGTPHWICKCGKNHRKKVHKNHLRLPKMRQLVPKRGWAKLCLKVGFNPKAPVQQILPLE